MSYATQQICSLPWIHSLSRVGLAVLWSLSIASGALAQSLQPHQLGHSNVPAKQNAESDFPLPFSFGPSRRQGPADTPVSPTSYETVIPDVSAGRTPIRRKSKGNDGSLNAPRGQQLITMLSSLSIVLGLLMAFVWWSRRTGSAGALHRSNSEIPHQLVQTLGRYRLTPRHEVCVVRFGSKLLALALSNEGSETLAELDDPDEVRMLSELCQNGKRGQVPRQVIDAIDDYSRDTNPVTSY